MVAAIKQHVTVNPDGNILIRATDLAPGTKAEVIVLVEPSVTDDLQKDSFLTALDALQKSMNLDQAAADRWVADNRTLREWNRPRE